MEKLKWNLRWFERGGDVKKDIEKGMDRSYQKLRKEGRIGLGVEQGQGITHEGNIDWTKKKKALFLTPRS